MESLDEMPSRLGTMNRSAAFTPLRDPKFLARRTLKRRKRRAPDGRFMESLYNHSFVHWDHEPMGPGMARSVLECAQCSGALRWGWRQKRRSSARTPRRFA